jgi:tetratricopeptide (TPR) repeat protein
MFKGEGYVRQLPDPPRNQNELILIRENVCQSLYSLVRRCLIDNDLQTAASYCEFLAQLDPTGHYNHFLWLGFINLQLGKKEIAKKNLEQALWICKEDKNWPKESMDPIIAQIEHLIELSK